MWYPMLKHTLPLYMVGFTPTCLLVAAISFIRFLSAQNVFDKLSSHISDSISDHFHNLPDEIPIFQG